MIPDESVRGKVSMSFFEDGRYDDGTEKYVCGISVGLVSQGKIGLAMGYINCWKHNPQREARRTKYGLEINGVEI